MQSPSSDQSGALSAGQYLDALRDALRKHLRSGVLDDLRHTTDMMMIEGEDPCEPLLNKGRREFCWEYPDWNAASWEMLNAIEWSLEGGDSRIRFQDLPSDLAGYVGLVHLELCAMDDPAFGPDRRAILLPLLVGARKREDSAMFRRYLVHWYDHAGDRRWNYSPESPAFGGTMTYNAALGIALGSALDPLIGQRVALCREWLDRGRASGTARFRDFVEPGHRGFWREIAASSAIDAAEWGAAFAT